MAGQDSTCKVPLQGFCSVFYIASPLPRLCLAHWHKPRQAVSPPGYKLHAAGRVVPFNTAPFGGKCHRAVFAQLPVAVQDDVERQLQAG